MAMDVLAAEGLRGRPLPLTVGMEGTSLVGGPGSGRLGDLGRPGGPLSPTGVLGCSAKSCAHSDL